MNMNGERVVTKLLHYKYHLVSFDVIPVFISILLSIHN